MSREATTGNSPAFQRRVRIRAFPSISKFRRNGWRRVCAPSAVPSGLDFLPATPGVKTPGYFQASLRDERKDGW